MGFGGTVSALLEAYSNCIALLKAFKRHRSDGSRSRDADRQTRLRRLLRSDRAKISDAYSARLSESGSQFEEGDVRATTVLGRVLRKLSAAIANLLRLSSHSRHPVLDYKSLMSLSNSSRVDAIKTIDKLSRRISSSRSLVLASSSPSSSSAKESQPSQRKHLRSSPSSASSQPKKAASSKKKKTPDQGPKKKQKTSDKKEKKATKAEKPSLPEKSPVPRSSMITLYGSAGTLPPKRLVQNRISMISALTDSTQLGEIPERKWLTRYDENLNENPDEYNIRPTYPLRPFEPEIKEKRRWGLFRRRIEE